MFTDIFNSILNWSSANPTWAGLVFFGVCAVDSLFVVGMLMPSIPIMLAMGALIAAGGMNVGVGLLWAIGGAIFGDVLSFWLGRH